jgi:hypothetical protein
MPIPSRAFSTHRNIWLHATAFAFLASILLVLTFTANDGLGGACTGTAQVIVPHNKKSGAIDDGQFFDSTVP